ncbi:MAG: nucleotidyltransferase domain-containing protein [Chloroflexota bacterium]|nr:nucleotidyltransferase family protein [Chloroflexota bacterium]MBI5703640.1 nucleotidyltransferase family protein [Chloroflexota bacterium]
MDNSNRFESIDSTYRLLALCARAAGHPVFYERLANQVERFDAWHILPSQAELHGMAPLLWHHVHTAGISLPAGVEQTLRGLHLRHRLFNHTHLTVLKKINALFEQAGIRAVLLKGLALALQYYPEPALRPVSDIDLLLERKDMPLAVNVLTDAGFFLYPPHASRTSDLLPSELKMDSPLTDGIRVQVELHTPSTRDHTYEEFKNLDAAHPLASVGNAIYISTPLNTLRYLSRHLRRHLFAATEAKPLPLKWMADMVSLVEQNAEILDWASLQRFDSVLLNQLEVFYNLTPLPAHLKVVIPLRQSSSPQGVNQYPCGWPQHSFSDWRHVGVFEFLRRTFSSPSEWWLRLYYGIGGGKMVWYGRIIYPLQIIKRILLILLQRQFFTVQKP